MTFGKRDIWTYMMSKVTGIVAQDELSIVEDPPVGAPGIHLPKFDDIGIFKFLSAMSTEHFERFPADGILGLSLDNGDTYSKFVNSLVKADIIDKAMFSLELGHEHELSWAHFGDPFEKNKVKEEEMHWIEIDAGVDAWDA
jgi:hypothetical protein